MDDSNLNMDIANQNIDGASARDFEDTQIAVESCLRTCALEELVKVARGIEIAEEEWKDKSKAAVMRAIGNVFDELPNDVAKKGMVMKLLMFTPDRVTKMIMKMLLKEDGDGDEQPTHETYVVDEMHSTRKATEDLNQTMNQLLVGMTRNEESKKLLRKEFKISGVIGTARDSLNYISICSQVADAKKKHYTDDEIVMAIRRAVAPASSLRNYLDSRPDMTLEQTLKFIRSAMKEKTSTELFQELSNAKQLQDEDAQKFVLRIMDLRERVTIASTRDGDIPYDGILVREMFLHTIRCGLRDDAIKLRLDPFLKKTTTDEVLIQELNQISSQEMERKVKLASATTSRPATEDRASVQVNEVALTAGGEQSSIQDAIQRLSAQLVAMQKDMDELKNSKQKSFRKRACEHCSTAGKANSCRHCWRCGAGDHRISDCPRPASN